MVQDAPYELSTVSALEVYVANQKAGTATYDFNANKALLKAYQSAGISNASTVADVLVLGLMKLPNKDFFELSYLIPTKLLPQVKGDKSDEILANVAKVSVVTKCADMLERAQYTEFWAELASNEASRMAFSSIRGCDDAIRAFILSNIASTFRNIKRSLLYSLLGFSNDEASGAAFLSKADRVDRATSTADSIAFVKSGTGSSRNDLSLQVGDMLQLVEFLRGSN
jgi:hypothetical protein